MIKKIASPVERYVPLALFCRSPARIKYLIPRRGIFDIIVILLYWVPDRPGKYILALNSPRKSVTGTRPFCTDDRPSDPRECRECKRKGHNGMGSQQKTKKKEERDEKRN